MLLFVNACARVCAWERERLFSFMKLPGTAGLKCFWFWAFPIFCFSLLHFRFVCFDFLLFVCLHAFVLFVCLLCQHEPQTCLPCAQWASLRRAYTRVHCLHVCRCVCVQYVCVCVLRALLSFRSVSFASSKIYSTLLYSKLCLSCLCRCRCRSRRCGYCCCCCAALRRCPLPPSNVTFSFSSHRQLQKATTKSCRCNLALHCCCPSAQLWRWLRLCLCLSRCCCLCRSLSLSDSLAEPAYQKRTLFSYAEELWRSKHEKNQRQTIKFLFVAFCIVVFVA